MQPRHRRGQRADPGGDADRDVQDVVDHQRGGGEEAGIGPEILARDGVGAAICRVGADSLPVGRKQHRQQHQDGDHDRLDLAEPGGAGSAEDHQRRFRPVS